MAILETAIGLQALGGLAFLVDKLLALEAQWYAYAAFGLLVMGAMELLAFLVPHLGRGLLLLQGKAASGKGASVIPVRGRHLDALEARDRAFIAFNRLTTPVFTFHLLQFLWQSPAILRGGSDLSLASTLGAVAALFVAYDSTYCLFHRALHHRSVYRLIHQHHHRQAAPSRGNTDAVNVHPLEYLPGEYNHLLAIWAVSRVMPVHVAAALLFIVAGGVLASLNHTRLDIKSPLLSCVYQVKYHDIHHWDPSVNFSQYSMLWDHIFLSFRAYPGEGGKESPWAKVRDSDEAKAQ